MHKRNLLLDFMLLITFLMIMSPSLTGVSWHEWLAIGLTAAIILHLLLHWEWIVRVGATFFRKIFHHSRLKFVVDVLLFVAFTLTMTSGLLISRSVLPTLGIQSTRSPLWRGLHDLTANLTLSLVGLHFALNWEWVVGTFRRYALNPIIRAFQASKAAAIKENPRSSTPQ